MISFVVCEANNLRLTCCDGTRLSEGVIGALPNDAGFCAAVFLSGTA